MFVFLILNCGVRMSPSRPQRHWYTWKRQGTRLVEGPTASYLKQKEAWTWLCRGTSCGAPVGILWVKGGASTHPHSHLEPERFTLLAGTARIRSTSGRLVPLVREKPYTVRSRAVHDIHAGPAGAYLHFTFPTFKGNWGQIKYHFKRLPSPASRRRPKRPRRRLASTAAESQAKLARRR